jgi:hypothetical protein
MSNNSGNQSANSNQGGVKPTDLLTLNNDTWKNVPSLPKGYTIQGGKVINDAKGVAIAVSPGWGAGWTTWNDLSPFEPKVIAMILAGRQGEIDEEWCKAELNLDNDTYVYCGGAMQLEVTWVPKGSRFKIDDYDGNESLTFWTDLVQEA